MTESFKHFNQIIQAGRIYNVGNTHALHHIQRQGHGQHVDNVNLYGLDSGGNVGLINGNSINYNDKSGDKNPFIILKRLTLLLLISFKYLRKLCICGIMR